MREHPVQEGREDLPLHLDVDRRPLLQLDLDHVVEGGRAGYLDDLLPGVPVHRHEDDVEGGLEVAAVVVAEDVEEVVEHVLQHDGAVEVLAAAHQDLGLVRVAGYLEI